MTCFHPESVGRFRSGSFRMETGRRFAAHWGASDDRRKWHCEAVRRTGRSVAPGRQRAVHHPPLLPELVPAGLSGSPTVRRQNSGSSWSRKRSGVATRPCDPARADCEAVRDRWWSTSHDRDRPGCRREGHRAARGWIAPALTGCRPAGRICRWSR